VRHDEHSGRRGGSHIEPAPIIAAPAATVLARRTAAQPSGGLEPGCDLQACAFARRASEGRGHSTCSDHRAARDDRVVNHRPKEDVMESAPLVDCAGRRRSPATLPGYHRGRPPRNKGLRYPPDPPTVEETIDVMRAAGDDPDAVRLRGLIVALWRAGLRISEALALAESDLDRVRGAIQVRHGKGSRRREVGMDRWAWEQWEQLDPWLNVRAGLPIGALFCVLRGATSGRPCSAAGVRVQLRDAAITAGVRRRLAPHRLRHTHAVECRARACRWSSYSGSSGMPTSGSPRCTCAASTTPRSCTPSTNAPRR
jgi:integrase